MRLVRNPQDTLNIKMKCNFILPTWVDEQYLGTYTPLFRAGNSNDPSGIFIESCILTELNYKSLLILKWQAQEAREVLSNALKTEIIITGTLREWYHIFKLRCNKKAHPQMRSLMLPVFEELLSLEPEIFTGLIINKIDRSIKLINQQSWQKNTGNI